MNDTADQKNTVSRFICFLPVYTLLLFAFSQYYLSGYNLTMGDTRADFFTVSYFYRAFFFHNEYAHWIPNIGYGVPTYLEQLGSVNPAVLITMIIGKVFGITDMVSLYRMLAIVDFIPFTLGLCLLCRLWFRHPMTWLIVCTATAMTTFVDQYFLMTFRAYSMLPLSLYCFCRFYLDAKAGWFWLGGICAVFGFFGNIPYVAPLWLLLLTLLHIPMAIRHHACLRSLIRLQWNNILPFLGFIAITSIFLVLISSARHDSVSLVPGRDSNDLSTPLNVYMTFSLIYNPLEVLRLLFSGCYPSLFISPPAIWLIYVGILPLLLCGLGAVKNRNAWTIALLLAAVVSMDISAAGVGTLLSYYFPGMHYFRYHLFNWQFFRIFVLLLAGWGCEYALSRLKPSMLVWAAVLLILAVDLTVTPLLGKALAASVWRTFLIPDLRFCHQFWYLPLYGYRTTLYVVVFLCGALLLTRRVQNWHPAKNPYLKKAFFGALLIVLFVDIATYRWVYYRIADPVPENLVSELESADCLQASPITYIPRRQSPSDPDDLSEAQNKALWVCTYRPGGSDVIDHTVANIDSWVIGEPEGRAIGPNYSEEMPKSYRTLLITGASHSLLKAFQGARESVSSPDDDKFRFLVGNTGPKLRFVPNAVFCRSEKEAADRLQQLSTNELHNSVVLLVEQSDADTRANTRNSTASAATTPTTNETQEEEQNRFRADVHEFSPNRAVFDIEVPGDQPGWLVYDDSYTKEWAATVDGIPVPVERANLAFKAVRVSPGKHQVAFFYQGSWRSTIATMAIPLCILFGLFYLGWFVQICLIPFVCARPRA